MSSRNTSGLPRPLALDDTFTIHGQYTVLYLGLATSSSFLEAADPTERLEADLGPRPGLGAASVLPWSSWPSRAGKSAEEASLCRCLGLARHPATCNSHRVCGRVDTSVSVCNNGSANQFMGCEPEKFTQWMTQHQNLMDCGERFFQYGSYLCTLSLQPVCTFCLQNLHFHPCFV